MLSFGSPARLDLSSSSGRASGNRPSASKANRSTSLKARRLYGGRQFAFNFAGYGRVYFGQFTLGPRPALLRPVGAAGSSRGTGWPRRDTGAQSCPEDFFFQRCDVCQHERNATLPLWPGRVPLPSSVPSSAGRLGRAVYAKQAAPCGSRSLKLSRLAFSTRWRSVFLRPFLAFPRPSSPCGGFGLARGPSAAFFAPVLAISAPSSAYAFVFADFAWPSAP